MQHFLHSKLGHVQKKKKSLASYWCDLCLGVKTFLALVITMILFQICAYYVVVYYKLNIILLSLYIIHWNLSLLNNIQPHCIEVGFHQRLSWRQSQSDTMWKKTKQIRSKLSTLLMTLLVMIYKTTIVYMPLLAQYSFVKTISIKFKSRIIYNHFQLVGA